MSLSLLNKIFTIKTFIQMVNQYQDSVALKLLNEPQVTTFNIPLSNVEANSPRNQATKMQSPLKSLIKILCDFVVIMGGELGEFEFIDASWIVNCELLQ